MSGWRVPTRVPRQLDRLPTDASASVDQESPPRGLSSLIPAGGLRALLAAWGSRQGRAFNGLVFCCAERLVTAGWRTRGELVSEVVE